MKTSRNIYENSKYINFCIDCGYEFNYKHKSKSNLVNLLNGECPRCSSNSVSITKYGELLHSRKAKLEKLSE